MYTLYYDSGTTNTRAYLFRDRTLLGKEKISFGTRDAALRKDSLSLLRSLYGLGVRLAEAHALTLAQIDEIWMSGMVTSPNGIKEVPHLTAPVCLDTLRRHIQLYREPLVFGRVLHLIPGIRTRASCAKSSAGAPLLGMMRGEETEIFGLLEKNPRLSRSSLLLLPGSHTQAAFIREGAVADIFSFLTGELFRALTRHTLLAASLPSGQSFSPVPEMVLHGLDDVCSRGVTGALYSVRTLHLFTDAPEDARLSYLEGILNGDMALSLSRAVSSGKLSPSLIAVCALPEITETLRLLFARLLPGLPLLSVSPGPEELPCAAEGYLSLRMPSAESADAFPAPSSGPRQPGVTLGVASPSRIG